MHKFDPLLVFLFFTLAGLAIGLAFCVGAENTWHNGRKIVIFTVLGAICGLAAVFLP